MGNKIAAFNCPNCGAAVGPDALSCFYCGSAVATRLCPSCFGSVSIGMRHCPHCGALAEDPAPTKAGSLRCPRCEVHLIDQNAGRNSLCMCTKCGGLWVGKNVFQSICTREEEQEAVLAVEVPLMPGNAQETAGQKMPRVYVPCPKCGNLMNHKNFSGSGIILDWCRDHGCWLDRNELQKIVGFIRDGGLRKAREKEQQRLKDQESRLRMQEFAMASLERRLDSGFARMENPGKSDQVLDFIMKMF